MKQHFASRLTTLFLGAFSLLPLSAQDVVTLPQPNKTLPGTLMQALANRHSEREFSNKQLTDNELANLLWAANGVNRPDGKRTAPSAMNAQPIDIYVCRADGAFLYDAANHQLKRITTKDLRPAVASGQDFVLQAPVSLVLVCDASRYPGGRDKFGLADAGYVSQNICLYCAAAQLACIPRGTMNSETLRSELHLTAKQTPLLNNVVGYKKTN